MIGTYNAIGKRRHARPTAATARRSSSTRTTSCASPTRMPLDKAAPLLCAGITLYSPLRHWNAGPGKKVAIIGLGGLGHMGVKIAHAMGAEVTVLSQSLKKMEDGLRLGADDYYATSDPETFKKLARQVRPDPQHRVGQSRPGRLPGPARRRRHAGRAGHARAADGGAGLPAGAGRRRSLSGSMIGGIAETQEMLDFCAEHGVDCPRSR